MKKVLIALTCMITSFSVVAEENIKFINADDSPAGELCIAAVNSDENLVSVGAGLGIPSGDLDQVYCNGMPLKRFAKQYRDTDTTVTAYVVSISDENPETQLCMAALTSDEQYTLIKDTHFRHVTNVEANVYCNNMPLRQFVRKYRNHLANPQKAETASL